MKRLLVPLAGSALLACGGSAGGPAPASSSAPVHVNAGYSEPVADNLPLYIAKEAGIFAKHGLDVDVKQVTSTQGIPALLAGEIDIDNIGGSEVLSAAAQGGDVEALATLTPVWPYSFYAAPGISSPADLKGKKIAITRPGGSLDVAVRVALKKMGLDPDKDVTIIQTGSVPNVIATLLSGQAQASVSKPPESMQLVARNFRVLLDLAQAKLPASTVCVVARKSWVAAHKDVAQRYIDSIVEAIAREKKDKAYTVQVLAKYTQSNDTAANQASYDLYAKEVVESYPHPRSEQFADAQAILGKSNQKVASVDLTKLYDASFVKSAASRKVGG